MSASSSTMRISAAISYTPLCRHGELRFEDWREHQGHTRAASAVEISRRVIEHHASLMFLHDPLDDGEAEARAFRARRHIRLRQTITILVGQANAVIGNADKRYVIGDPG